MLEERDGGEGESLQPKEAPALDWDRPHWSPRPGGASQGPWGPGLFPASGQGHSVSAGQWDRARSLGTCGSCVWWRIKLPKQL